MNVTLEATGHWLGKRTGAGGRHTSIKFVFFCRSPWFHGQEEAVRSVLKNYKLF